MWTSPEKSTDTGIPRLLRPIEHRPAAVSVVGWPSLPAAVRLVASMFCGARSVAIRVRIYRHLPFFVVCVLFVSSPRFSLIETNAPRPRQLSLCGSRSPAVAAAAAATAAPPAPPGPPQVLAFICSHATLALSSVFSRYVFATLKRCDALSRGPGRYHVFLLSALASATPRLASAFKSVCTRPCRFSSPPPSLRCFFYPLGFQG